MAIFALVGYALLLCTMLVARYRLLKMSHTIDAAELEIKSLSVALDQERDHSRKLGLLIGERDRRLMEYADALDRCADPKSVGELLRAELRRPLSSSSSLRVVR